MRIAYFLTALLLIIGQSSPVSAFGLAKKAQPRQTLRKKKIKKQDAATLQTQAETSLKRHQNETRMQQYQQMQKAQQMGYQQYLSQQKAQ